MAVDLDQDRGVLADLDEVAVAEIVGLYGRSLGGVELGTVGGVEVAEDPFARPGRRGGLMQKCLVCCGTFVPHCFSKTIFWCLKGVTGGRACILGGVRRDVLVIC